MDPTAEVLRQLLMYGLLPLWLLAGCADWLCHRMQRIEFSAGEGESLLHLLMLAELGAGIALALLLEITAGVLALLLLACIAHELTTWTDLGYAAARRRIPPIEQWVHALQLALPWAALAALAVIHHRALRPLWQAGDADWALRPKQPPLPMPYLLAVGAGALVLVVGPFAQEWWRCRRAGARGA